YAAAYRRHDDLLAEYPAPPHQLPQRVLLSVAGELAALPSGSVYRYLDSDTPLQQHLLVVAPITQEGETLGYLVLVHRQERLHEILLTTLAVALGLTVVLTALALALARRAQRVVTRPLLA